MHQSFQNLYIFHRRHFYIFLRAWHDVHVSTSHLGNKGARGDTVCYALLLCCFMHFDNVASLEGLWRLGTYQFVTGDALVTYKAILTF